MFHMHTNLNVKATTCFLGRLHAAVFHGLTVTLTNSSCKVLFLKNYLEGITVEDLAGVNRAVGSTQ